MSTQANPSVSVVIPVYNGDAFLERTLRTALQQTYQNLDIIVVDDGSTDATPEILERFGAENECLRTIRIANSGVANARNVGTKASEAHYVAYLDADDLWHPTKIEKQVAALEQHRGDDRWAACYALFRLIDRDDNVLGTGASHNARGAIFPSHLVINHVGNGSSIMVRRKVALEVDGFEPEYAAQGIGGCEDHDFQLRVLQKYKIEVIREFLVGYRTYPGNMSSNHYAMAYSWLAVCEKFSKDVRVPSRLRRIALAQANQYAINKFLLGRHWKDAFAALWRGLRLEPRIMIKGVLGTADRVIRNRWSRLLGLVLTAQVQTKREFYDYSPSEGLKSLNEGADSSILRALKHIEVTREN